MALWIGTIILLAIMVLAVLVVFGRRRSNLEEAIGAEIDADTEQYHDQGAVPVVFMSLMAMSCVLVNVLAGSAGILLGYWREGRHA